MNVVPQRCSICDFPPKLSSGLVSEDAFKKDTYWATLQWVLAEICNASRTDEECAQWFEVNQIKRLFHPTQPWKRAAVNSFGNAAWRRIGYEG
jgi:hypothetical protein